MITDFDNISEDARIWIYPSKDILSEEDQVLIINKVSIFLNQWEYHQKPLLSAVSIKEDRFVIVALDDSQYGVGGCSIDALQRLFLDIENDMKLSLLNRFNIFCEIDNHIQCVHLSDISNTVNKETRFFDLTIQKKSDIDSYLKPISDGWCNRYF